MHGFGAQRGTPAPSGVWEVRAPGRVDPDALTPRSLRSRSSCAGGPLTGSVLRRGCVRLGGHPQKRLPKCLELARQLQPLQAAVPVARSVPLGELGLHTEGTCVEQT